MRAIESHLSTRARHDAAPPCGYTLFEWPARGPRLGAVLALPDTPVAGAVPLVAVHGIGRDAYAQAVSYAPRAAAAGRPVIAPDFDAARFPRYQQVVVKGRADLALLGLLADLRLAGLIDQGPVDVSGYSGGAQFAHRFALLYPRLVRRITLCAAGWYTFPDETPYPRGLGAWADDAGGDWGPCVAEGLERFLSREIEVCVGDRDDRRDKSLRTDPALDAQQGTTRVTRAHRWCAAMGTVAARFGLERGPRLHLLRDVGHDFRDCIESGEVDRIALPED